MALSSLAVLRNRNFALVWLAGLISSVGTAMQMLAVAALITELTHLAVWGALIASIPYLSAGFIAPFSGVLADRYDRRRLLIVTSVVEALLALTLAALYAHGDASASVLVVVTIFEGVLVALGMPARQAMVPELVEHKQITSATSLNFAANNVGRLSGAAVGGLLIVVGSYAWVFIFNAASFLAVVVRSLMLRLPKHVAPALTEPALTRLRRGFEVARAEPGCWASITIVAVMAVLVSPFIGLVPAMAQLTLGGSPIDTAHLITAQGAGAIVGAIFLPISIDTLGRRATTLISVYSLPFATVAFALAPDMKAAMAALFFLGMTYTAVLSSLISTVQERAPIDARGRVIAVWMTTLNLAYPLGSAIQGLFSDFVGMRVTLGVAGAGFLVFVLVLNAAKPLMLSALGEAGESYDYRYGFGT